MKELRISEQVDQDEGLVPPAMIRVRHINDITHDENGIVIWQGHDSVFIGREHFDSLKEIIDDYNREYSE